MFFTELLARVHPSYARPSGQLELFSLTVTDVLGSENADHGTASHLRALELLSFDPDPSRVLTVTQATELRFLLRLAAAGWDDQQLAALLADLERPYAYFPDQMLYDAAVRRWVALVPLPPEATIVHVAEEASMDREVEVLGLMAETALDELKRLAARRPLSEEDRALLARFD